MIAVEEDIPYLDYHVRWRSGEWRPGKHAARHVGAGGNFRGYRPFWQLPDARHIDVRRSIVDPNGDVVVRQMEQRSSITMVVAADFSRSMDASSGRENRWSVIKLVQSAARSSLRGGDGFGFLAFDEGVPEAWRLAPTRSRGTISQFVSALQTARPEGRNAEGLALLATHLPLKRCLVLLASDFFMPMDLLDRALDCLALHDVVPIVLSDGRARPVARAGLMRVEDAETGRRRLLLLRPSLQRRFADAADLRRSEMDAVFHRHGLRPYHVGGPIDIAAVSRHLMGA